MAFPPYFTTMVFPRRLPAASATVMAFSEKSGEIMNRCDENRPDIVGAAPVVVVVDARGENASAFPATRRERIKDVNFMVLFQVWEI